MGTKDNRKKSNRHLHILIWVFAIALLFTTTYGIYYLIKMDKKVEEHESTIKAQKEKLEIQGSQLDQKDSEILRVKRDTKILNETLRQKESEFKKQVKAKDNRIRTLEEETKRQKEKLSVKQAQEKAKTEFLSAAPKSDNQAKPQQGRVKAASTKTPSATVMKTANTQKKSGRVMNVRATAYTAYCAGCSGTTATGIDLRSNPNQKVIAVDPNVIPLGSKVYVEGYGEAIAGDTGGAIKGNRIDVFIPSTEEAYKFGVRNIQITILE